MPDRLSNEQLKTFDTEYVTDSGWQCIKANIDRDFPDGRFSFLDVGGGNGVFADRVLSAYPNATGIVLDSSELLLAKNTSSDRKQTILADAMTLREHCSKTDVVFFNWVLHHLVKTGSYNNTRENIRNALIAARFVLTPRGRISIYENLYNGVIDNLPSRMIFELTSNKALSPITRYFGSNTAGVGVCFLSRRTWLTEISTLEMRMVALCEEKRSRAKLMHRLCFLLREVRRGHFWIHP